MRRMLNRTGAGRRILAFLRVTFHRRWKQTWVELLHLSFTKQGRPDVRDRFEILLCRPSNSFLFFRLLSMRNVNFIESLLNMQFTSESLFPKSFNNLPIIVESLYHVKWIWLFIILNKNKGIVGGLKRTTSRVYVTAMMIRRLQRYLLFHKSKTTNKIIQPSLESCFK